MMGSVQVEERRPAEIEFAHEKLQGVRADVGPDGDSSEFMVYYEGRLPFSVLVPFEKMGALLHEVRFASSLMLHRQRMKLDRGLEKLLELCETAMRPKGVDVLSDRDTGDKFLIFQFTDHSPLVLRQTIAQCQELIEKINTAKRTSAH